MFPSVKAASTGTAERGKPQTYRCSEKRKVLLPDCKNGLEIEFKPRTRDIQFYAVELTGNARSSLRGAVHATRPLTGPRPLGKYETVTRDWPSFQEPGEQLKSFHFSSGDNRRPLCGQTRGRPPGEQRPAGPWALEPPAATLPPAGPVPTRGRALPGQGGGHQPPRRRLAAGAKCESWAPVARQEPGRTGGPSFFPSAVQSPSPGGDFSPPEINNTVSIPRRGILFWVCQKELPAFVMPIFAPQEVLPESSLGMQILRNRSLPEPVSVI